MVIDIQHFDISSVSKEDSFILDTHVLLYIHRPQIDKQGIAGEYSKFIQQLMQKKCSLIVSSINLQEALNVIECSCWERYNNGLSKTKKVSRKVFRGIISEREKVKVEQITFMNQIKQFYDIKAENISENELTDYTDNLERHRYDPIDYIVSAHYKEIGIITNDTDFTCDADANVYILNKI